MSVHDAGHLICHDHDLAVAQAPQWLWVVIAFLVLEANNFDDVVNLSIFHDLLTKKVMSDARQNSLKKQYFYMNNYVKGKQIIPTQNKSQSQQISTAFSPLIWQNQNKAGSYKPWADASSKGADTD